MSCGRLIIARFECTAEIGRCSDNGTASGRNSRSRSVDSRFARWDFSL